VIPEPIRLTPTRPGYRAFGCSTNGCRWHGHGVDDTAALALYYAHYRDKHLVAELESTKQLAADAWEEGRRAGEAHERDMWRYQAGTIERPERPVNPYEVQT